MRVLLTGGNGFIGTQVREQLLANGHDVRVLDREGTAEYSGDIRDTALLDSALTGVDCVCHLAAKVGLGVDVHDTPDYAGVNVGGTAVLLAAMARAGNTRLTLASSMVVYGDGVGRCATHGVVRPEPRTERLLRLRQFEPRCPVCGAELGPELVGEHAPLDPQNAYAASKVSQEHFAASWARATGSSVAALRYHNVYGPGMPRNTPYAGVAAIFRSALLNGAPPAVFEDGGQRRDFVHVRDVAAATVAAVERHDHGVINVNVGSGTPRTVGELAAALASAADGPDPVVTNEFRLGDVRHITADSSRLRALWDWHPTVAFTSGVAELMA